MHDEILIGRARVDAARTPPLTIKAYAVRSSREGNFDKASQELRMAKIFMRVLQAHYPGHPWAVEVHLDQGIATISIPFLLGSNWAYVLKLTKDIQPKDVIEAGGHILERFRIPRSRIDTSDYMRALQTIPLLGLFRARHRDRIPA